MSLLPDVDRRLDLAPCGFITFGADGRLRYVNHTLLDLLGYERADLVDRHIETLFTVGTRIFYQTHWFPLVRMHGHAEEIFLMLRTRAGTDLGMIANTVRRDGTGGEEYDCVLMRVTERQKYEEELLRARRSAEKAEAEVRSQRDALAAANQTLEEQAVELEQQQQLLQEQAAELETAATELQTVNDTLIERTQEAEYLRDIAEDANRAKSTFLAVMSHELRTPLNAIAGYAQILEMGVHGKLNEKQVDTVSRILRSEQHLLRLINEVLDLARIEAGTVSYAEEAVDVADVMRAVAPMIEPQMQRKNVSFEWSVKGVVVARADRGKVQQIVINLLSNAAKFTTGGGSVTVGARQDGEHIRITVRDTGVGIAADKQSSIFEPFVQVDSSSSRGEEGSGLGLAISRDMARGMKGDLTVESAPGQGATFTLTLPASSAD